MPLEIKDCPFCGEPSEARMSMTANQVCCRGCGARGPYREAEAEALDAWNIRAHDEVPSYAPNNS